MLPLFYVMIVLIVSLETFMIILQHSLQIRVTMDSSMMSPCSDWCPSFFTNRTSVLKPIKWNYGKFVAFRGDDYCSNPACEHLCWLLASLNTQHFLISAVNCATILTLLCFLILNHRGSCCTSGKEPHRVHRVTKLSSNSAFHMKAIMLPNSEVVIITSSRGQYNLMICTDHSTRAFEWRPFMPSSVALFNKSFWYAPCITASLLVMMFWSTFW